MKKYLILLILLCVTVFGFGQKRGLHSGEIQLKLEKLNVLGSVLYIAAHPDDENTGVLAYLANEKKVRTAYLSLTRGDGGQNLIGSEIGDLLGVIRTQELLAARRIDGAEQFFTRAVDFGYTKSIDEALSVWGEQEVLADVVWTVRKFQPDVMITRFTETLGGHGHHLASAKLAKLAFEAAANPQMFPEQLKFVNTWQPKRLLFDVWSGARLETIGIDTTGLPFVNVGKYNALLGKSYTEIAAISRSQHKCQGFGSTPFRGNWIDYFQLTIGEPFENDIFDGIDLSWNRIAGSEKVVKLIQDARNNFQPNNPKAILPTLISARKELRKLNKNNYVEQKINELNSLIYEVSGLWIEAINPTFSQIAGASADINLTVVNRNGFPMEWVETTLPYGNSTTEVNQELSPNIRTEIQASAEIPENALYSHPYWLRQPKNAGLVNVSSQLEIGQPEILTVPKVVFTIRILDEIFNFETPLQYRWTDPVAGESLRDLEILPPLTVNFAEDQILFADENVKNVRLQYQVHSDNVNGTIHINAPDGWLLTPNIIELPKTTAGEQKEIIISIQPPQISSTGDLTVTIVENRKTYAARSLNRIKYDHIPIQTLTPPAIVKIQKMDVKKQGEHIAYISGAGDKIPEMLRQVGYAVTVLDENSLDKTEFAGFDAVICGIRAYNTRSDLITAQPKLMEYVKNGGRMIVQYNTSHRLKLTNLGPYDLKLSRDRITMEDAELQILDRKNAVFNTPNKITNADFENWVQERGLYFPKEWDEQYTPLLSGNDPNEPLKSGMLLYTKYGKGHYFYTGLSFFRQLPAGVPGAFRLFVNMLSVE